MSKRFWKSSIWGNICDSSRLEIKIEEKYWVEWSEFRKRKALIWIKSRW
jgi:hypothetical protein